MSPLKCSNFFSVSSLKEPPEGGGEASERQGLANRALGPHPGWNGGCRGPGATTLSPVACSGHC